MGIVLQWRRYKQMNKAEFTTNIPLYINIEWGFLLISVGNIVACVCAWCERSPLMLYWYKKAGLIGGYKP